MAGNGAGTPGTAVIKIGGGLSRVSHALERVCASVDDAACGHSLVVVPGGGPFADAVRRFERRHPISPDAAHWMAILAMDQYGHVLADRIARAELVEEPGAVAGVLGRGRVAVLAPSRWMRSADVLPHSWAVTSDSIAAFIAGAVGATRLILIKMADTGELVDPYFRCALPAGLSYEILNWERIEELPARLSG